MRVVMTGATGAVGTEVVRRLTRLGVERLTLFGRRPLEGFDEHEFIEQHTVDVLSDAPYAGLLEPHDVAICTLGVGEPSKVSRDQFIKIDKEAVLRFAQACRDTGVRHFQLLSSVGVDASSASFYLRTKGELEQGLRELNFERLSLFHPSMIMTPENRYGLSQAVALKTWPIMSRAMLGPLQKFRGINVNELGAAMAENISSTRTGEEVLEWAEIRKLAEGTG